MTGAFISPALSDPPIVLSVGEAAGRHRVGCHVEYEGTYETSRCGLV